MTEEITHGTTTACGECCDVLLSTGSGTKRHLFVMLTALYEVTGKRRKAGDPSARTVAWGEVYGTKFNGPNAARTLGIAKLQGKESSKSWKAAGDSYRYHQRLATQAIVDRKAAIETEVLDRIKRLMRQISEVDYTLFYHDDEPKSAMVKLLRMVVYGLERQSVPRVEYINHDLIDSGVLVSYQKGRHPASHKQLAEACRRCAPWALRSVAEIQKLGLGRFISSVDQKIGKVQIDRTAAFKLVTLVEGLGSTTLNIGDAQEAQDRLEDASVDTLSLLAPELVRPFLAGVAWCLGQPAVLVPGQGEVTKREGERLAWRDGRWAVEGRGAEGHLQLIEEAS